MRFFDALVAVFCAIHLTNAAAVPRIHRIHGEDAAMAIDGIPGRVSSTNQLGTWQDLAIDRRDGGIRDIVKDGFFPALAQLQHGINDWMEEGVRKKQDQEAEKKKEETKKREKGHQKGQEEKRKERVSKRNWSAEVIQKMNAEEDREKLWKHDAEKMREESKKQWAEDWKNIPKLVSADRPNPPKAPLLQPRVPSKIHDFKQKGDRLRNKIINKIAEFFKSDDDEEGKDIDDQKKADKDKDPDMVGSKQLVNKKEYDDPREYFQHTKDGYKISKSKGQEQILQQNQEYVQEAVKEAVREALRETQPDETGDDITAEQIRNWKRSNLCELAFWGNDKNAFSHSESNRACHGITGGHFFDWDKDKLHMDEHYEKRDVGLADTPLRVVSIDSEDEDRYGRKLSLDNLQFDHRSRDLDSSVRATAARKIAPRNAQPVSPPPKNTEKHAPSRIRFAPGWRGFEPDGWEPGAVWEGAAAAGFRDTDPHGTEFQPYDAAGVPQAVLFLEESITYPYPPDYKPHSRPAECDQGLVPDCNDI